MIWSKTALGQLLASAGPSPDMAWLGIRAAFCIPELRDRVLAEIDDVIARRGSLARTV